LHLTLATSAPAAAPTTAPQQATTQGTSGTSNGGGGTGSCGTDYYRNSVLIMETSGAGDDPTSP
jgi:hypothetical protein